METYLFKFSACLALFWLVYVLFLERQSMHQFKRFYLLGAVLSALTIPLLTITHYIEPVITDFEVSPPFIPIETSFTEIPQEHAPFWNLETVLWLVYSIGILLFTIRFTINLIRMYNRISNNETVVERSFIYVLLRECRIPHSFFKYIFLNKSIYEANAIPREVLLHEEAHAKQLHSIDIIAIELLQIVFWFHPLIYILKHKVKLNHEFLADQAVLKLGTDTRTYQNILLQFSSNAQDYELSSAINYSSIKKRFTIMKTQTSKTRIWLSSLLLLPIIAVLFYSFSTKEYVEKEPLQTSEISNVDTTENKETGAPYNITVNDAVNKVAEVQEKATAKQVVAYNAWAKQLNASDNKIIKKKDLEKYQYIYSIMTTEQKKTAEAFPKLPPPPPPPLAKQEKATAKQVAEYNTWAKNMNTAIAKAEANKVHAYPIVKQKDVEKYKSIYMHIMSPEQIKNAAPWPKVPPVPKSSNNEPKTGFIKIKGESHYYVTINKQTKYYNNNGYETSKDGSVLSTTQVNASDVIPNQYITKIYSDSKVVVEFKDNMPNTKYDIIDIPTPPMPTSASTLDHIIHMAKKGATIYYEEKVISSDEAIQLFKTSKKLHITTTESEVYISK